MKNREQKFIEEIIKCFHSKHFSKKVVKNFHLWLLSSQDYTAKDEAMNEVWHKTPYSVTRSTYRSLNKVKLRLGMALSPKKRQRSIPLRRTAMRVAAVLLPAMLVTGLFFIVRNSGSGGGMARFEVPHGQTGYYLLDDGTEVWLNAGSRLECPVKFKGRKREVKLHGEGFFHVAENTKKPFIVQTRNTETKVVGTQFNISCYDNQAHESVTVLDGFVDVTAGDDDRVHSLEADRQLNYGKRDGQAKVIEVDAAALIRWRENGLVFENSTYEDILAALQRKYAFKVVVDSTYLNGARYRMQFVNGEPVDYVLDVVHSVVGLPYRLHEGTLLVGSNKMRNFREKSRRSN